MCCHWFCNQIYLHSLKLWRVSTEQMDIKLLRRKIGEKRCRFICSKEIWILWLQGRINKFSPSAFS